MQGKPTVPIHTGDYSHRNTITRTRVHVFTGGATYSFGVSRNRVQVLLGVGGTQAVSYSLGAADQANGGNTGLIVNNSANAIQLNRAFIGSSIDDEILATGVNGSVAVVLETTLVD